MSLVLPKIITITEPTNTFFSQDQSNRFYELKSPKVELLAQLRGSWNVCFPPPLPSPN